jgi:hypothetical protein
MREKLMLFVPLCILACALPSIPQGESPVPSGSSVVKPTEPGVYYETPKGFVKMEQITMSGGGTKHMAKIFVPGLTPQMVYTFRGAHAPVQVTDAKPTFYIVQMPYMANIPGYSDRDIVIVRFDVKKRRRELQITSGGNAFTFKAGYSRERTPDIKVTRLSDTSFSVVPTEELKPGEYLLTFGSGGVSGWDFGVHKEGNGKTRK